MDDAIELGAGCALAAIIFTVVSVIAYAIDGLILAQLWSWFMVPLGLPVLSIPMAIGVGLVFGFMTWQDNDAIKPERSKGANVGRVTWLLVGRPLLILAIAWVVHQFV